MPHAAAARNFTAFVGVVIGVMTLQSYISYQTRPALVIARETYAELLESEKQNARQHTSSLDDRDSTKKIQAENTHRIEALEAEVKALRDEMKAMRGDR